MKISFIGAGNVAWHLSQAFEKIGEHHVVEIYSKKFQNAQKLAEKLYVAKAMKTLDFSQSKAEILFICVPDDAISHVAAQLLLPPKIVVVHTAGNRVLDDLLPLDTPKGVFYPLQTFSKAKKIDFKSVPICIEASNSVVEKQLQKLAFTICDNVAIVNAHDRKLLHLSAVFACNFTNHLFTIADKLLTNEGLDFAILRPLIAETIEKAFQNGPEKSQTGPAVRGDKAVLEGHAEMLAKHPAWKNIYVQLSNAIADHYYTQKR